MHRLLVFRKTLLTLAQWTDQVPTYIQGQNPDSEKLRFK
jgi:hypothetical protein